MNKLLEQWQSLSKHDKSYAYVVLVLTVTTFCLRLTNLGYLTLWVDEYVHANTAKYVGENGLITGDNNGILYTLSILPFFKLFGANEFWARFPSVIYGTLTIPLAFLFCRRYFNSRIGVIVSLLLAVSLYVTFWSRIGRMYAIVMFFYLLLVYVVAKLCNIDNSYQKRNQALFDYLQASSKTLVYFLICLLLATLSQLSAIFIIFSISFFHLILFVQGKITKKNPHHYTSVHAILAYAFVLFLLIALVPSFQAVARPILSLIMPQGTLGFILPDLNHLSTLPTFDSFDLYCKVLSTDMPYIYLLGWVGFVVAVIRYKKTGWYLVSVFVLVFMMLSFLFRGVSLPRYLIFLYPYFLISIAISVDEIIKVIERMLSSTKKGNSENPKIFVTALVVLFFLLPFKAPYQLVTTKAHGQVVPKALSVWYFVNWQEPLKAVNQYIQPQDAFLSTMSHYAKFYLGKGSIMFRQMRYNPDKKQYEKLPVDTTTDNAGSLEALIRLYNKYQRGWLCADYYFDNVMTDPMARDFVIKNMKFMYDMSNGDVKVFHWDKSQPMQQSNGILDVLTKQSPVSMPYEFGSMSAPSGGVTLAIEAEGLKYDGELGVIINNNAYAIPVTSGNLFSQTRNSQTRQWFAIRLDARNLSGNNKLQLYLPEVASSQDAESQGKQVENNTKIAIYNLRFF